MSWQTHRGLPQAPINAKVSRALFIQSGTYNDQMRRPITSQYSTGVMARLEAATQGGTNLTRQAIAPIAADILRPQAEVEGVAGIDQGWAEQRARFLIEFSTVLAGGAEIRKVMVGYTNYMGISGQGHFNPDMKVYINAVSTLRVAATTIAGVGRTLQSSVVSNNSILTGHFNKGGTQPNDLSLRPMDVFQNLSSGTAIMSWAGDGPIIDERSTFGAGPVMSDRSHTFNSSYVSKMLTAAQSAFQLAEDGLSDMPMIYRAAAGTVGEVTIADDTILAALHALPSGNFRMYGFVTWSELKSIFPNIEQIAQVVFHGGAHAKSNAAAHQRGQTEHWHGSNQETLIATQISQSIPGLMMENMIGNIGLTITNHTVHGKPEVVVTREPMSLSQNIDLTYYVERLKQCIMLELVPSITFNNYASLTATITCDIFGETWIRVSFNGGPMVDYAVPSFCDSRFTPLVTGNPNALNAIKQDFSNVISNIGLGSQTPSMPTHRFTSQLNPGMASSNQFVPSHQPVSPTIIQPTTGSQRWK